MVDAKDMTLGELVEMMISTSIDTHNSLSVCTESPYHTKEEIMAGIIEEHREKIKPYIDELNEREKSYSK